MHSDHPTMPLCLQADPWGRLFDTLTANGAQPERAVWLIPRIELAAPLKKAMGVWRLKQGQGPLLTPLVVTVDRLSQTGGPQPRLQLQTAVFHQLKASPALTGAPSEQGLWALSSELCDLARTWVAAQQTDPERLGCSEPLRQWQAGTLSGPEAELVRTLASVFQEELRAQLPGAVEDPRFGQACDLVWLDDGEPLAQQWVQHCAGGLRVHRFNLDISTLDWSLWAPLTHAAQWIKTDSRPEEVAACCAWVVERLSASGGLSGSSTHPPRIALAVVDRGLARQVRARLEEVGVLVDDRTGWRLSTTRAAGWVGAVLGWLAQPTVRGLAAWIESPWVDAMRWWDDITLRQTLLEKMRWLGTGLQWPQVSGLVQAVVRQCPDAVPGFERFERAWLQWSACAKENAHSMGQWALSTMAFLEALGPTAQWQSDRAARACMDVFKGLAQLNDPTPVEFDTFQMIWRAECENARIRPVDIQSPVRMMPLLSLRMQRFDAVLVLGGAASQFVPSPPGLLPPDVLRELGLPGPLLARQQQLSALMEVLATAPNAAVSFAHSVQGSPESPLGLLERLDIWWRNAQQETTPLNPNDGPVRRVPWVRVAVNQTHRVPKALLPSHSWAQEGVHAGTHAPRISVSAVQDLVTCPAQFVLRRQWQWADLPLPRDDLGGQAYGQWVHEALERFFKAWLQQGLPKDAPTLHACLNRATEAAWLALTAVEQIAYAPLKVQWLKAQAGWVEHFARALEDGLAVQQVEMRAQGALQLGRGIQVQLDGRLDRVENSTAPGEEPCLRVVDVKTGSTKKWKNRLNRLNEFPQLLAYAWLYREMVPDSANQPLELVVECIDGFATERLQTSGAQLPDDRSVGAWADRFEQLIVGALQSLWLDHAPARAVPSDACSYCEFAAMCRPQWMKPYESAASDAQAVRP